MALIQKEGAWMREMPIRAFKFESLENLPTLSRQDRTCQPFSVTSFPLTHLRFFFTNF